MTHRSVFSFGMAFAILIAAASDASAGWLFHRRVAPAPIVQYPQPYVCYPTPDVPSTVPESSSPSLDNLTADEKAQLEEMMNAGFIEDEEELAKYAAATTAQRKEKYVTFKKDSAPPTPAELDQFLDMVKAGQFKVGDLPAYASLFVSQRKEAYDTFKKTGVTVAVSNDELTQFLEMVKGNTEAKKGGIDLTDFATYQKLPPAQRKALYDAWKK